MHFLPVNNFNGHGFWQFSSDLIHAIYANNNAFRETKLCDASSLDPTIWFEMLEASVSPVHPARVEMVDYPEKRSALRTRDRQ